MSDGDDVSYYDEESENYVSDDYDEEENYYEEDDEYYDEEGEYEDYEEYGEYEEIDYDDDDWDGDVEYEEFPEIPVSVPVPKEPVVSSVLIEDDPTDPRTWNEARQIFDESDSEDEENHEEALREMMEAKIIENRKAILLDPFNILKPKQIVERLNVYKRKKLQECKEKAEKNGSTEPFDVEKQEKEIEQYIETVFSPAVEGFEALEYISAMHGEASFEQLKAGAMFLNANIQQNTIQLKQFVQKNIRRYVTCKDTIDVIGEVIQHNELSKDRGTAKLIATHQEIISTAKSTYGPLYKRKKEAERLRKTLQLLDRFHFILNIPASMKNAMERGDYEQVLRDYEQSKEYQNDKSLAIFAPITKQVDSLVAEFEKILLKSLEDTEVSFAQHKKTMKLLVQFGMKSDPFWYLLVRRKSSILSALDNAALPPSSHLQMSLTVSLHDLSNLGIGNQVNRVCIEFSSSISEFYSLCVQYEEEKQLTDTSSSSLDPYSLFCDAVQHFIHILRVILLETVNESPKKTRKRAKTSKRSKTKKREQIQVAVNDPQGCLLSVLLCVEQCKKQIGQSEYLNSLISFVDEITEKILERSICDMIRQINEQESGEQWGEQVLLEPGFLLSSVEEIIQRYIHDWGDILSYIGNKKAEIHQRFVEEGMQCFLNRLESLSEEVQSSDAFGYQESLLVLLQSARESRISVFPRIINTLSNDCELNLKKFEDLSKKMEEKLVLDYCTSRAATLDEIVKETTLPGNYAIGEESIEVGDYAKNILLQLVIDHAQIFGLVPTMTKSIISTLFEHILTSFADCCAARTEQIHYNHDLSFQLLLDILFIHEMLKPYSTKTTRTLMGKITNILEKAKLADKEQVLQIIKLTKIKTRILFQCFQE